MIFISILSTFRMHSLMETSRKQFICVKQKSFTQDHQTQFASLSNRFMDSSKHRDNGTRSYMTLSSVWDLNDLNLTAPSTYLFRVMFESLFPSSLTISQLLHPILTLLTPLSKNLLLTLNCAI